ncbi:MULTISPECIES: site-specific integrase [Halomonadaceae]|uniref:site-specific integrase n=1 Tax=Halomonadaceae TaxID=28256 RepID=UPI001583D924|nr:MULTISPECIES: site-specific integrase [Halomonas]MDI4636770.1 tyrosine-type recombinase/integrase [Halomonas sp. BMC7]NUJ61132.1 site-specific integrase [Halomonas taeanensis]|tara:strand:+ start:14477 stop:15772 length:1296 start_codon:yes stop_codon:yes gene_type:complete
MAYLMKDRHQTYYLRIVLNKNQQAQFGRKEYRRSLSTKSKREANRRLPEAFMEAMRMLSCASLPRGGHQVPVEVSQKPLLSDLFKAYKRHLTLMGYQGRTVDGKDPVLNILFKIIGDKQVDLYTRDDVRLLQDTLLKFPPRFQRQLTKGMSVKQVVNLNKGGSTISTVTFNNYMAMYIAVFNHAIKEGYIENNPFRKTRIHQKRLKSSYREAFSDSDLQKIFSYVEGKVDIGERKYKDASKNILRADRYWLTYLGYYTSARLNELAQLYTSDVYKIEGTWCIHIRAGNEYQRLKNLNSERLIPIHHDLMALGFLDYVNKHDGHLFPMLKYSKEYGYGAKVSTWFTVLLRKLEISQGKRLSYHSFRHTGANILKQKGTESHLVAALLGHSTGTITYDRYGKALSPKVLVDVVNSIPSIRDGFTNVDTAAIFE